MIIIQDNILPKEQLMSIRQSAIDSGFGTWTPPSHQFGSGVYKGMNWKGHNSALHIAVSKVLGSPIYPNQSFFRILTEDEEERLIHSDRNDGSVTAIVYLSDHEDISGTAFYRHKVTGLTEMPSIQEMQDKVDVWGEDMKDISKWEQTSFARGLFGTMLIFSAPLFHGRVPAKGIGKTPEDARMIWVCHMEVG